jgi:hypothetical protein
VGWGVWGADDGNERGKREEKASKRDESTRSAIVTLGAIYNASKGTLRSIGGDVQKQIATALSPQAQVAHKKSGDGATRKQSTTSK